MTRAPAAALHGLKRCAALAAGGLAVASLLASCGSGSPTPRAAGPGLVVATGLYPLAQAVDQIGQGRANGDLVVPAGQNPLEYVPDAAGKAALSNAGLILLGPAGFQPSLDSAAGAMRATLVHVAPPAGGTYFWLDPAAMRDAVPQIAAAMESADPRDAATFKAGARAFEAALRSTDIDYQSTLSACPRRDVFMPDLAFAQTARAYGLIFHAIAGVDLPPAAVVRTAVAAIESAGATTVFVEPWVGQSTARAAAQAAGVKVRTLDTLLGAPPGGWPRQATYVNLLEANLGALSAALGCPDQGGSA